MKTLVEKPQIAGRTRQATEHMVREIRTGCLINWAAKQEKFQPQGTFFLLTSTFIEQMGSW
jgi:hypothetical protein